MTPSRAKYLFAVVGLVLLLGSLVVCTQTASFVGRAARAQGIVTGLVRVQSSDYYSSTTHTYRTRYAWAPVVRFQHDGQLTEFSNSVASSPPAYHVGETVTVLYLESNPYQARIDSFISLWALPMIFGGIGAILLAFGAGMILRSRPANS